MTTEERSVKVIKAPKPDKNPQHTPSPFVRLIGQQIVVQQRGGVILTGTVAEYRDGMLRLEDAHIQGARFETNVPWVLIDRGTIGHCHAVTEVRPVQFAS